MEQISFITMVCASEFYFTSNKTKEGSANIMQALWWTNLSHAGSIAIGSLVTFFVSLASSIWFFVPTSCCAQPPYKKEEHCCFRCCGFIFEAVNKDAYCFMAISG